MIVENKLQTTDPPNKVRGDEQTKYNYSYEINGRLFNGRCSFRM